MYGKIFSVLLVAQLTINHPPLESFLVLNWLFSVLNSFLGFEFFLFSSCEKKVSWYDQLLYYLDATIKAYLSVIVPIMTNSFTIRIPCNDTQYKKLQWLDDCTNFIIKSTVISVGSCLNRDFESTCLTIQMNIDYKHFQNILRFFDILPNLPFTTSDTMGNYYL